jgi:hypothetical protein
MITFPQRIRLHITETHKGVMGDLKTTSFQVGYKKDIWHYKNYRAEAYYLKEVRFDKHQSNLSWFAKYGDLNYFVFSKEDQEKMSLVQALDLPEALLRLHAASSSLHTVKVDIFELVSDTIVNWLDSQTFQLQKAALIAT